ncbi:hypothetical protein BC628DRAFT_1381631, partial [Trametes gibbosa]
GGNPTRRGHSAAIWVQMLDGGTTGVRASLHGGRGRTLEPRQFCFQRCDPGVRRLALSLRPLALSLRPLALSLCPLALSLRPRGSGLRPLRPRFRPLSHRVRPLSHRVCRSELGLFHRIDRELGRYLLLEGLNFLFELGREPRAALVHCLVGDDDEPVDEQ